MGNIGMGELALIFLVALLLFGAKRIPEIARGLGQGIREFQNAMREVTREITQEEHRQMPRPQPPSAGPPVARSEARPSEAEADSASKPPPPA